MVHAYQVTQGPEAQGHDIGDPEARRPHGRDEPVRAGQREAQGQADDPVGGEADQRDDAGIVVGTQDTDTSGDASGDTQIDYDTGGSDSDSELFNENLVQEETYY